jgi:surfactin synthase thioesterase subunit/glycosyltransferase involved in cell wall biosynthesis
MRILLAQNSLYYPAHGGGDKSNRLLIEALAARGHACRVVARTSAFGEREHKRYLEDLAARHVAPDSTTGGVVAFRRLGVEVQVVTNANLRAHFCMQIAAFRPDVIVASTDDPAQLLLDAALDAPHARVVYLARATLAVPFGPDCAFPSGPKTEAIRRTDAVVGVSQYVAGYIRRYAGIDAVHVPISLMEIEDWPDLGRIDNEFVTLVNPCAVKGISILLALADAMPAVSFAAVPTWGTNERDRAALAARPNIRLVPPVDEIDDLLRRTSVLLVPSLWAEARSRIVLEAMLRGVPVMASDVGGISEAKMGVPYLLPVRPIAKYEARLDDQMVPVADVPPQDIGPWCDALRALLGRPEHYAEISGASRRAALVYAENLNAAPFERILEAALLRPPRRSALAAAASAPAETLSPEKRQLLGLLLRKRAGSAAWFPGAGAAAGLRLFCFPHAGGGTAAFHRWSLPAAAVCPARLPGRESRLAETPYERMELLVEAVGEAIQPYLDRPFAFLGHSMGAAVAFELARWLRRRGLAQPCALFASAARAPQFRRNHIPPPDPGDEQFLAELRRLEGTPAEVLDSPELMRAILPALRADTALFRRYVYTEEAPLACPIRVYGGETDPNVHEEHLAAWAEQTTASCAVRRFAGGHFYWQSGREDLLRVLAGDLEELC